MTSYQMNRSVWPDPIWLTWIRHNFQMAGSDLKPHVYLTLNIQANDNF